MREHTIEHVFPIAPLRFWTMFFLDDAFREGFYGHMQLDIERLEIETSGAGESLVIERTIEMTPHREVPGVIDKLFSGARRVREQGRFSAAERRFEVDIDLPVIGRRVDFSGVYTWPASDSETRRTWKGHCNARIPIVGGRLERYLLGEVEKSFVENERFTSSYIARGGAGSSAAAGA